MSTVAQYQFHLTVDGRDCGIWKKMSGGGMDSEETYSRDAYGLPRKALGGQQTADNVTMSRTFYADRDGELMAWLKSRAGRGAAIANRQKLDPDGNAVGHLDVTTGVLKSVKPSDGDVEGSEVDEYTIEIGADTV